ncbi:unnamed protein product [Cuscuta epithymum]|uniref:Magnesium transporter n=1 Tax=Cuscuta epithymum TaxID=186058 RepID=A0AAV0FY60_9ASTE|nr:unnamed protein product [Cuscuta epithymum]
MNCNSSFMQHIKAIITSEEVLLRDPQDDNVIPIVEELQRRLPLANGLAERDDDDGSPPGLRTSEETDVEQTEFPFEFQALEVALEGICSFLDTQTRDLETAAYPALDVLTAKISSSNLDRVRKLKSAMTRMTSRVQKVRDELEQLLEEDDDMGDLYLSRKSAAAVSSPTSCNVVPDLFHDSPTISSKLSRTSRRSTHHGETDVEELEMLLEAYFVQIESTMNKLTTLREYIDDTEDYINIQLDNHRNQLIQLWKEPMGAAGAVLKFWYGLLDSLLNGGCHIRHEYPPSLERSSRLPLQMGGHLGITDLRVPLHIINLLCTT